MTHSAAAGPRPSRRAIVRGAAWSVPVVSLAVAAPAFAASGATSTLTCGQAVKWSDSKTKHVSWDLFLANGPVPIKTISIEFTYTPNSGGPFTTFEIYGFSTTGPRDTTWVKSVVSGGKATATHLGIPAGSTTNIHTDFAGGDNSNGTVQATATITYVGVPGSFTQTVRTLSWDSGNEHLHPL